MTSLNYKASFRWRSIARWQRKRIHYLTHLTTHQRNDVSCMLKFSFTYPSWRFSTLSIFEWNDHGCKSKKRKIWKKKFLHTWPQRTDSTSSIFEWNLHRCKSKKKKKKNRKLFFLHILDLKGQTRHCVCSREISMDAKAKKKKIWKFFKKILDLKEREQTRLCQSLREISMDAKEKKNMTDKNILLALFWLANSSQESNSDLWH